MMWGQSSVVILLVCVGYAASQVVCNLQQAAVVCGSLNVPSVIVNTKQYDPVVISVDVQTHSVTIPLGVRSFGTVTVLNDTAVQIIPSDNGTFDLSFLGTFAVSDCDAVCVHKTVTLRVEAAPLPEEEDSCTDEFLAAVVTPIMLVSLAASCLCVYLCLPRKKWDNHLKRIASLTRSNEPFTKPPLDEWEYNPDNLAIASELGSGAFGVVFRGRAEGIRDNVRPITVAIKQCKPESDADDKRSFLNEANIMKRFNHPNVIRLLGVVTQSEPLMIITEFVALGDLKAFLRGNHDVTQTELMRMGIDIAKGLGHLASCNFIHRDLACRNCLINEQFQVKIADFGLSRDATFLNYYRLNREARLPVRWMCLEGLRDAVFTVRGDMWSYGVVLWELFTFCEVPYPALGNQEVYEFILGGNRLSQPRNCPDEVYQLMFKCWNADQLARPSASDAEKTLVAIMEVFRERNASGLEQRQFIPAPVVHDVNDVYSGVNTFGTAQEVVANEELEAFPGSEASGHQPVTPYLLPHDLKAGGGFRSKNDTNYTYTPLASQSGSTKSTPKTPNDNSEKYSYTPVNTGKSGDVALYTYSPVSSQQGTATSLAMYEVSPSSTNNGSYKMTNNDAQYQYTPVSSQNGTGTAMYAPLGGQTNGKTNEGSQYQYTPVSSQSGTGRSMYAPLTGRPPRTGTFKENDITPHMYTPLKSGAKSLPQLYSLDPDSPTKRVGVLTKVVVHHQPSSGSLPHHVQKRPSRLSTTSTDSAYTYQPLKDKTKNNKIYSTRPPRPRRAQSEGDKNDVSTPHLYSPVGGNSLPNGHSVGHSDNSVEYMPVESKETSQVLYTDVNRAGSLTQETVADDADGLFELQRREKPIVMKDFGDREEMSDGGIVLSGASSGETKL